MSTVFCRIVLFAFAAALGGSLAGGCAGSTSYTWGRENETGDATAVRRVHGEYVEAINANDLERLMGVMTEDVVFLAAGEPPYVGKAAVRPWVAGYLQAYKTHWDKPVEEFVVSGDWAFERYSYTSTDTPVAGGEPVTGTGWGLVIYRRDADGQWRVARDAWGPDRPAP